MVEKDDILIEILEHLKSLYASSTLKPGRLLRVGLKSGWNVVIGTDGQCGMAMNFSGDEKAFGKYRIDTRRLKSFIGKLAGEVDRCGGNERAFSTSFRTKCTC